MKTIGISLSASLLLLAGTATSHASLIAFDPFHSATSGSGDADPSSGIYVSNPSQSFSSLESSDNRNVTGGGIVGFGSQPWTSPSGHTTFRVQANRLATDSRTELANGAVQALNFRNSNGEPSSVHRTVARELDPYTPSSTYYMSSVFQANTAASGHEAGAYLMHGFGNSAITHSSVMGSNSASQFEGLLWGFRANEAGDRLDLVVRATTDAATNTVSDFVVLEGVAQLQTYFLVARVNVNETGADTITVWLDPDFSLSDPAGGMTFSAEAFSSTASLTHFAIAQNGLLHSGSNGSTNRVGYIDGISLGTTYASAIPEPSTYALALGGAAFLFLIVRRVRGRKTGIAC